MAYTGKEITESGRIKQGFAALKGLIIKLTTQISTVLEALDATKAEKEVWTQIKITPSSWTAYSGAVAGASYMYNFLDSNITAKTQVEVVIDTTSQYVAAKAGLFPSVHNYAGGYRLYAARIPTADVILKYRVFTPASIAAGTGAVNVGLNVGDPDYDIFKSDTTAGIAENKAAIELISEGMYGDVSTSPWEMYFDDLTGIIYSNPGNLTYNEEYQRLEC